MSLTNISIFQPNPPSKIYVNQTPNKFHKIYKKATKYYAYLKLNNKNSKTNIR